MANQHFQLHEPFSYPTTYTGQGLGHLDDVFIEQLQCQFYRIDRRIPSVEETFWTIDSK
jgi:hypothetical protein